MYRDIESISYNSQLGQNEYSRAAKNILLANIKQANPTQAQVEPEAETEAEVKAEVRVEKEQREREEQKERSRHRGAEWNMLSWGGRQQTQSVEKSPRRMQNETVT